MSSELPTLADSVRVTRDGFEFHVVYRTRFGETKTVRLEAALEAFQNMRAFKPHINMQKSGIRLVVTRWDGESFIEEPGIENVEHASPEEVEVLIRRNLQGGPSPGAAGSGASGGGRPGRSPIVRLELLKQPHDAYYHFDFHRQDGTSEHGPMLIRMNLARLSSEGLFAPGVTVAMTALNDRVIVTRKPQQAGAASESFPLATAEDAKRIESVLNQCLAPVVPESNGAPLLAATPVVPKAPDRPHPEAAPTASKAAAHATNLGERVAVPAHPEPAKVSTSVTAPAPVPVAPAAPEAKPVSKLPPWVLHALAHSDSLPFGDLNAQVFEAIHTAWERPVLTNEHDLPAFTLNSSAKDGSVTALEIVLAPHYLLCSFAFGYLRFGAQTRVFVNRLDDYISFPHAVLRGVQRWEPDGLIFVVTSEFCEFLQRQSDRNYRASFLDFVVDSINALPGDRLIWPVSREEKLFQSVCKSARAYELPVTSSEVVLVPSASEFIGFKKVVPYGMEFRDGPDYVRFTPEAVEFSEAGESRLLAVRDSLLGWALDGQGRVCACYRTESGFTPPPDAKLVRFLSEAQREEERPNLNFLAECE